MKFLISIFLMITISAQAKILAGRESGGGDQYSISFIQAGENVAAWLKSSSIKDEFPVNPNDLLNAIAQTKVDSTENKLTLNGIEKDAINYPREGRIIFNRKAWDRISTSQARNAFVFHEYLGILGIDDSNYIVSRKVLSVPNAGATQIEIKGEPAKKLFLGIIKIEKAGGLAWVGDIRNTLTAAGSAGVSCTLSGDVWGHYNAPSSNYTCYLALNADGSISSGTILLK